MTPCLPATPTLAQRRRPLTIDPTHQINIQGSYVIPGIDVAFNAYFHAITGKFLDDPLCDGAVRPGDCDVLHRTPRFAPLPHA